MAVMEVVWECLTTGVGGYGGENGGVLRKVSVDVVVNMEVSKMRKVLVDMAVNMEVLRGRCRRIWR